MSIENFDAHKFLVDHLCETTPQKCELLKEEIQRLGIRFELDTTSLSIEFWADPVTNVINVPVKCLTRLRAQSYAYYSLLIGLLERAGVRESEDLENRLRKASELLTWAVRTDIATALEDGSSYSLGQVPETFEAMLAESLPADKQLYAEEVFRLAVTFILHHELAHLRLHHIAPPGPDSIREEYEADNSAAGWLLDIQDQPLADRLARLFGVVVGLGWLSAFNVYIGTGGGQTHPPSAERLRSAVSRVVNDGTDEAEFAWGVCESILFVHAYNNNLPIEPQHLAGSFKQNVDSLVAVILKAKP